MQRPALRVLTTSIYPLIGLAGLMAMSGCAAVPMLNMANSLLKPAQPAQVATSSAGTPSTGTPSTGTPLPDIFSALVQRLGITQPTGQATKTAAAQIGTTQTATAQTATAASQ